MYKYSWECNASTRHSITADFLIGLLDNDNDNRLDEGHSIVP